MKTKNNTKKTSAQDGREKREKKMEKAFFSLLEEHKLSMEEFREKSAKRRSGVATLVYETIADKCGCSPFTVMRFLQRKGYVTKRKFVLVPCEDDIPEQPSQTS